MNVTEPEPASHGIAEQRVRELAYQIWETEGRPEGQATRHWELACKLAEAEAGGERRSPSAPTRRTRKPHEAELPQQEPQAAPRRRTTRIAPGPRHNA
jgi:hypothetical protein